MARKRKSKYFSEYRKERRRVSRLINTYKKKGYEVEVEIPSIPKTITQASINRLKKYTPRYVSERSFAPNLYTGEKITVREYMARGFNRMGFELSKYWGTGVEIPEIVKPEPPKPQKPEIGKEPKQESASTIPEPSMTLEEHEAIRPSEPGTVKYSDVIISNFEALISEYPPRAMELAYNFYYKVASELSRDELAEFLDTTYNKGLWLTPEEAYRSEKLQTNLVKMMNLLELSGGEKREILDELDMETDFYEEFYD